MLERGDFDLNSVYNSRDSLAETLKQTMISQELVFRRQVSELHQLYRVQIARMEEVKQKGLYSYKLHKGGIDALPVILNHQSKCSMDEFMQSENSNLHYELQQPAPVYRQKPLDLQLPADEFISQCVDDISGKGMVIGCLKESVVFQNYSWDKGAFDVDYPDLSLSIGRDATKKGIEHKSLKGKKTCSSSLGIIELEATNIRFPNYEACLRLTSGSAAPKSCFKDEHKVDSFLRSGEQNLESFPQSGINDGSYGTTLNISPVETGLSCHTQSLFDSGLHLQPRKFLPDNNVNENKSSPTCKVNYLDLNTVQLEEEQYFSNNHSLVVTSSITSSSPVLDQVVSKSNKASSVSLVSMHDINPQKDVNFEDQKREKCGEGGKLREGNGGNISFVDLDSDFSELCSSRSDPKISSVGSSSKISNGLSCEMDLVDAVGVEVNLKKGAEPFEQLNCCKLSSSSESECMIDHHSSSIKSMQSGVGCDDKSGTLATHSGEQDLRSSDSTGIQCIIRKEPEEVDGRVQTAAELLVQISLEKQASCQGEMSERPLEKFQNEEDDQPQCSLESYEAMVLKAEDSSPDDYCVSSNAFLVDESEKKDLRYKLKRGTRMKDFQQDILPSLSTLSRQEIREDVNILEGVIRSREYKRMRAKMADGGDDWCRSTRSKRSRVNRRYYN